jgi:hypothetical protein
MNNISLAEVVRRFDASKKGIFWARIDEESNEVLPVTYVSPYASNGDGAFIAIPEPGVEILVCKPKEDSGWYYLGSTFEAPPSNKKGGNVISAVKTAIERVLGVYAATGFPMKMAFVGKYGSGLIITDEITKDKQNVKTVLKSITKKKISLVDSPKLDAIYIDTGAGSKITLTDNPQNGLVGPPANAVLIETTGPQKLINAESQTDIVVLDGKEINVLNSSTGFNAAPGSEKFGNINLQSDTNDINLYTTRGPSSAAPNGPRTNTDGRIFLECLNPQGIRQVIQLQTKGLGGDCVIRVKSSGKVEIQSILDIDVVSGGNVNMLSAGNINITAAGEVNIQGGAGVNADGATINLNSGTSSPAIPIITEDSSHYDPFGVLTYSNGIFPV